MVAFLGAAGCANKGTPSTSTRTAQTQLSTVQAERPIGPTGLRLTPIEFLASLKRPPQSPDEIVLIFDNTPGWIREQDIVLLMAHLDSQARCAHVKAGSSSHDPSGHTTEGHQAAFLIQGYRAGRYPPAPDSGGFTPDVEELKRWYQQWSMSSQPPR